MALASSVKSRKTNSRVAGSEGIALTALVLVFGALFAYPLFALLQLAVAQGVEPLATTFDSRSVQRAVWHSLESSIWSAFLALVFGTLAALTIGLTDVRCKVWFTVLLLFPMMIPPHVTAIAWVQALGPSSPLLNLLGIAPEIGSTNILYSREGVIALLAAQHSPLVCLLVLSALRGVPKPLLEAACVAGAKPQMIVRSIVLPLLQPTLVAAFFLAFIAALGNFGIPALLGIPARYTTLPVLIWRRLASFGPSVLTDMAVLAGLMAVIVIAAVFLQLRLVSKQRHYITATQGVPFVFRLHQWRVSVETGFIFIFFVLLVLPLSALFATAVVPTYGVPLTLDTFTLDSFREVLFKQSVTVRAFLNSISVATAAAICIGIASIFIANFISGQGRIQRKVGHSMVGFADVTYAIPGLVISVAFIIAFIKPLPVIGISIYNTLFIIFLAYVCAFFTIGLKPVIAAFLQMDSSLDEAARTAGARFGRRLFSISAPLAAPAIISGAILVFLTAYNEVTVSTLLWSSGTETIGTTIFNYEDGGYTTLAAAMAFATVVVTAILMFVMDRLGKHAPPGVVPWRW